MAAMQRERERERETYLTGFPLLALVHLKGVTGEVEVVLFALVDSQGALLNVGRVLVHPRVARHRVQHQEHGKQPRRGIVASSVQVVHRNRGNSEHRRHVLELLQQEQPHVDQTVHLGYQLREVGRWVGKW